MASDIDTIATEPSPVSPAAALPAVAHVDGWVALGEGTYLVHGWCSRQHISALSLHAGESVVNLAIAWCLRLPRPDAAQALRLADTAPDALGFVLLATGASEPAVADHLELSFDGGQARSTLPQATTADPALGLLAQVWPTLDATRRAELLATLPAPSRASLETLATAAADALSGESPAPVEPESEPAPTVVAARGHIDSWQRITCRPGYLVQGWSTSAKPALWALQGGAPRALQPSWVLRYTRPDVPDDDAQGFVLFAPDSADASTDALALDGALPLQGEPESPSQLAQTQALIARLWRTQGAEAHARFCGLPPPELLAALAGPPSSVQRKAGFNVDRALQVPGLGLLVDGWMLDRGHARAQLILVDPASGRWADLAQHWQRTERPDVLMAHPAPPTESPTLPGFVARVPLSLASDGDDQLLAYLVADAGHIAVQALTVQAAGHALDATQQALAMLRPGQGGEAALMEQQLGPAIEAWQQRAGGPAHAVRVDHFGLPPARPRCSVVIPLVRREDHLRVQLALLALDHGLAQSLEVLVLIDDPRQIEPLWQAAPRLHAAYRQSFTLVATAGDAGHARAVNLGARLARGELLLVLAPDCIPGEPGWLRPLMQALDADTNCGAVAPRLLQADGLPQASAFGLAPHSRHAGWKQLRPAGAQGYALDAPAGTVEVDALSGACLLTRRALFLEVGGFEHGFVFGRLADALYCRRLAARGLALRQLGAVSASRVDVFPTMSDGEPELLLVDPTWCARVDSYNHWRFSHRLAAGAGA